MSLYISPDKLHGLQVSSNDVGVVGAAGASNAAQNPRTAIVSSGGVDFVTRRGTAAAAGTTDTLLGTVASDGNIYASGSVFAGSATASSTTANTAARPSVPVDTDSPWKLKDGVTAVLRRADWKVGVGTDDPRSKLHVVGGAVRADALHGKLDFSELTHVPLADSNTAGLVLLRDDDVLGQTGGAGVAASMTALRNAHAVIDEKLSIRGGVVTGNVRLRNDANVVVESPGRIGVGFTDPATVPRHALDVRGDINFSGAMLRNGHVYPPPGPWTVDGNANVIYTTIGAYNVGIGTPDPMYPLDVVGAVRATSFVGDGGGVSNLSTDNISSGVLPVRHGGSGAASFDEYKLLVGRGTEPFLAPASLHWDVQNAYLGIGDSNPQERLHVAGNIRVTGQVLETSDAREKIEPRVLEGALASLAKLNGYRYFRKIPTTSSSEGEDEVVGNRKASDGYGIRRVHQQRQPPKQDQNQIQVGLLAQEVMQVCPEAVYKDGRSSTFSLSYASLVALLVEALKELHALHGGQIADLHARVARLSDAVTTTRARSSSSATRNIENMA